MNSVGSQGEVILRDRANSLKRRLREKNSVIDVISDEEFETLYVSFRQKILQSRAVDNKWPLSVKGGIALAALAVALLAFYNSNVLVFVVLLLIFAVISVGMAIVQRLKTPSQRVDNGDSQLEDEIADKLLQIARQEFTSAR